MASSYNTFPSLSLSPPPCAPSFSPRHTEQGHAPSNPSPNTSYLAYQCTYVSNDYKLESVTSSDKVGLVSTHPNSPLCPSPFSSLFYSSPTSPQPSLYQVPPSSCSTVNGPQSNMSKHGISPTSPTTSPSLPYGSFSFSSRNCRLASNHPNEVNGRTAIGTNFGTRKPSSHYVSSRSNKADILLDRKAFISLEKSINWQSMLNDASPLASSSSTHRTSPFSRYCSTNQPSDQCTLLTGQAKDNVTSSRVPNMFSSPQLSPVTSPFSDTSQCRSFQGNCSLDANLSLSTAEREFTRPGMKDVPSWLKLLRLHKYAPFFSRMSYEEMLELTEDVLENRNITKGARQKLILSIQKLKARSAVLLTSEQELVDFDRGEYRYGVSYSSLSQVLFQIRAFLSTPIRPSASNGGESSPKLVSPGSYSSVSCSSLYSLCSSPSSSVSLSPPFLTSNPVDVNNNHGSYNSGSNRLADPKELFHCWSSLTNTDLSDIITRLIGHMHHILVGKCKKRLKKLKLWQEYFKDIFDKLSVVNTEMNLQEREVYERYSLDNSSEQVNNDSDREENDEDEDSGLLDFESGVTAVQEMSSPSLTPNGTDKDSGVDEANCDSDNCSLDSDILTLEEEEELYMVMRSVLDKCLSHEAFWSHQVLYMHWREQLQCMINALRYIMNDSAAVLRTCSPIAPKAYSTEYCFLPGRYSSKSSVHQSQCPPVNGLTKHKLSTFQSCKKSPNSNYPKTSPSPNYSASMSAGRRLLHNRLRSTINHGTISNSSTHLNSLTLGSNSDEKGMRANLERRNLCLKSPSKLDSGAPQPGPLYSNLSVIPQLSNLFSSPITLNFHPNTAFAGNSPEANLRNLLLQQLLTTQQQQPQAQAQAPISGETSHSKGNSSSQSSPVSGTIDYNSAARSVPLSCTTLGLATPIKSPSTIDSCQFNSDMATSCASKCNQSTGDETHRPIESTNHPLDLQNGASLWSLNDPLDNMDAKKLDWNATDLLSSLDYCNNGGKIEDMLSLLDNNLDMIDWPNNCPTTMAETITFDDIEQLCIRMAEHALDINDDSIYS